MPEWPQLPDPGAALDQMIYSIWLGLAVILWGINRALLMLAFQLGKLRDFLVNTAFLAAYEEVVRQAIDPIFVTVATIAATIFVISVLLLPMFGVGTRIGNLRQIILLAVLVPAMVLPAGAVLRDLDNARVNLGQQVSSVLRTTGVSGSMVGIFGQQSARRDMPDPRPLYATAACDNNNLIRTVALVNDAPVLAMDDMAAALVWANAADIHCPPGSETGAVLPAAFFTPIDDNGPGYADRNGLTGEDDAGLRAAQIARTQQAVNRLVLAFVPATLAVLEALVQLIFSLALIVLWASLPIVLLFMLFQSDGGALTRLAQQALDILKVSWAGSFVLGIIFVCVEQTARLGNATAYIGFSIGATVITAYIVSVAAQVLRQGFTAFGGAVGTATGLSLGAMGSTALGAARLTGRGVKDAAEGLADGVGNAIQASVAGRAAMQATGNSRYARAARLGTIRPIARIGEVAAAMGLLKDEEIQAGLFAGSRVDGPGGTRAMRRQINADRKIKLSDGTTVAERASARATERQLRPSKRERIDAAANRARDGVEWAADGGVLQAIQDAGDSVAGAILAVPGAVGRGARVVGRSAVAAGRAVRSPVRTARRAWRSSVEAARDARPDPTRTAIRMDPATRELVTAERRDSDAADVTTEDVGAVSVGLLSSRGYTWQYNTDDGTADGKPVSVSYWKDPEPRRGAGAATAAVAATPAPRARRELIRRAAAGRRAADSPLARQSREAQAQQAAALAAAPAPDAAPAAPQEPPVRTRIERVQEAHADVARQRQQVAAMRAAPAEEPATGGTVRLVGGGAALTPADQQVITQIASEQAWSAGQGQAVTISAASSPTDADADYQQYKVDLREQEIITTALHEPATAGQVQAQLDLVAYEDRAADLTRESVVVAAEAATLPPATNRETWKAQHRAQRQVARIERERSTVQQQITRRQRELRGLQTTQGAAVPQFSRESLRAVNQTRQTPAPQPAPAARRTSKKEGQA